MLKGFSAYFQALGLVPKLNLWRYFLIPGLISVVFAFFIGSLAWGFSDNLGEWFSSWMSLSEGEGWGAGIKNKIVRTFQQLSTFLGAAIIIVLGLIVYKNALIALSGPFMGPLSEKVERHLTGHATPAPPFWSGLSRGLQIGLRNTLKEIAWMIPLFLLGLIPVLSIFCTIAIFLVQAYYAGFGNLDLVLERHRSRKESIQYVKNNRGVAIGNGIPFLLMIGFVVGIFFAPTLSTIAATIAYHDSTT